MNFYQNYNGFRKIVVLGSNSFSGSHFVNYALENSDAEIIGISRSPEYDPIFLPYLYKKERSKRFQFYRLNLNNDLEKILDLFDEKKPEAIVNFAAQAEVRYSWTKPEQWYRTNVLSLIELTNNLKDRNYLKRFVHISTPEVYGSTKDNMEEKQEFNPTSPYAASRAAGDQFLILLKNRYNFPVLFTRAANVYGAHQQLYRIIPKAIIKLKKGEKISLNNMGRSIRSFIHIEDVVEGTFRVMQKGHLGHVYHFATNNVISIKEIIEKICDIMDKDLDSSIEIGDQNKWRDAIYSLNTEKARKELDWSPKIELKQGIRQTINWIDDNWDIIKKSSLDYKFNS